MLRLTARIRPVSSERLPARLRQNLAGANLNYGNLVEGRGCDECYEAQRLPGRNVSSIRVRSADMAMFASGNRSGHLRRLN